MNANLLSVLGAAVLAAFSVSGAQCEGLTKAGVRCKREAAADSKFCIGHADQAKKPQLKDDGSCWAVTEKGTRCKHAKDGASDYCKQHAADRKPTKPVKRCRALKYDGEQCSRGPETDSFYCAQHRKLGAGSSVQKTPAKAK